MISALRIAVFLTLGLLAWYTLFYLPGTELADFNVYREAARTLLRGEDMYGTGYAVTQRGAPLTLGYLYPPFLAVALSWFETIDSFPIPVVWCLLLFLSTVVGAWFLADCTRSLTASPTSITQISPTAFLGCALFVLLWPPSWDGLMWGQANAIVFMLISGALWFTLRLRYTEAGILLGIAATLKLTPIILLIPFLLRRSSRAIAGAGAAFIICALCSSFSPRGWLVFQDFFTALSVFAAEPASIDPYYDYSFQKLLGISTAKILSVALLGLYLTAFYRQSVRAHLPESTLLAAGIALGIPIMVLVSPCVWFHHFLWLTIPIAIAATLLQARYQSIYRLLVSIALALGVSLYLHVIVRHHIQVGETVLKALIPILICMLLVILNFGLSRRKELH